MKSIKKMISKIWEIWMWVCTLTVTAYFLIYLFTGTTLWILDGFRGNIFSAMEVDSCLDQGGAWDYEKRVCMTSKDIEASKLLQG